MLSLSLPSVLSTLTIQSPDPQPQVPFPDPRVPGSQLVLDTVNLSAVLLNGNTEFTKQELSVMHEQFKLECMAARPHKPRNKQEKENQVDKQLLRMIKVCLCVCPLVC